MQQRWLKLKTQLSMRMALTKNSNVLVAVVMTASLILFGSVRLVMTDVPEMYKLPEVKLEKAPTLENRLGKPNVTIVGSDGKTECRVWNQDGVQIAKHCRVRYRF